MSNPPTQGQVLLAEDRSASAVLQAALADAAAAFPEELGAVALPADAKAFRRGYPALLPRFEAARLASGQRLRIAQHLAAALQRQMVWGDARGRMALADALREPAAALPLCEHRFRGDAGWRPTVDYRGERFVGAQLAELAERLAERGSINEAAERALRRVCADVLEAGRLRLVGRRVAVLGGAAEMAPTRHWLEAGADVLWLDTRPPPARWKDDASLSGRLLWPTDNVDFLTQPREVLATLLDFAEGGPLDLGLYAYAPGQARELRLTASMNAVVDALAVSAIASVTVLVSPTTPNALSAADLARMRARCETRPRWEALCAAAGLLGRGGGSVRVGGAATTRTVVGIQGASYQAAQYLGKVATAECWAGHGQIDADDRRPLRVSANTAAITQTRSLAHPVFAAAFEGAGALGVETFTPDQSRVVNGLLAVRDWLSPELPQPGAVRVHGGLHALPYPLESALRVAAAIGFARSPRLLPGLWTR